ncbi:MAG: hypothetical protein ABEJ61_09640 [Haloferacaceae archaeon]
MHGRYGDIDSTRLTKRGFLFGLALFLVGAVGELVGHAVLGGLPGWESALLFDAEVVGIAVAFLSVFVFGVVVPLTE